MVNVESTEKALHNLHEDNAFELNLVPTKKLKRYSSVFAPILHRLIVTSVALNKLPTR